MMAGPALRTFFTLSYLSIMLFSWYVCYAVFRIGGIYQGQLPEMGREELSYYAKHPLMALLNRIIVSLITVTMSIFCLIGTSDHINTKPTWLNTLLLFMVLGGVAVFAYVLQWANAITNTTG